MKLRPSGQLTRVIPRDSTGPSFPAVGRRRPEGGYDVPPASRCSSVPGKERSRARSNPESGRIRIRPTGTTRSASVRCLLRSTRRPSLVAARYAIWLRSAGSCTATTAPGGRGRVGWIERARGSRTVRRSASTPASSNLPEIASRMTSHSGIEGSTAIVARSPGTTVYRRGGKCRGASSAAAIIAADSATRAPPAPARRRQPARPEAPTPNSRRERRRYHAWPRVRVLSIRACRPHHTPPWTNSRQAPQI